MHCQFLEIRETKNKGKGLFATKDIPAGTSILQCPEQHFITFSLFANHPIFQFVRDHSSDKIVEFAFMLAFSQHEPPALTQLSQVKRYLSCLPHFYHNLICWSDSQLEQLQNQDLVDKIRKKKASLKSSYNQILGVIRAEVDNNHTSDLVHRYQNKLTVRRGTRSSIPQRQELSNTLNHDYLLITKQITFQDVLKYVSVIESRNAYFPNEFDSTGGALIPQLELFNHGKYSKCRVYKEDQAYKVKASGNISKGEEVLVNYGQFNREQFLEFYGMLPRQEDQKENSYQLNPSLQAVFTQTTIEQQREELIIQYNNEKSRLVRRRKRTEESESGSENTDWDVQE